MARDYRTTDAGRPAERVLEVTTDEAFGTDLAVALDREGRLIDAVVHPDEALSRMAGGDRYDCVVVDHDPPIVHAPTVLDRIGSVAPDLPVVVCASDGNDRLASDVVGAGVTDYLVRPTDDSGWDEFVDRIDAVVETGRDRRLVAGESDLHRTIAEDVLGEGAVGLLVTDAEGIVRWANDVTGTFFGIDPAAVVGDTRRLVVRETLEPVVTSGSKLVDRLVAPAGEPPDFLVRVETAETTRWLDARSRSLDVGPFAGGRVDRFADVTSYVHSDYGLRELQRLMVDREESFSERLHRVLDLGVDHLDLPYGFVTAIDHDTQTVLDAVGDHERLEPGETAPLLETYCRRTLAVEELVTLPDAVAAGWENDPAYQRYGLGSYVGSPVAVDDDHYGTLCFAGSEPKEEGFTDDEELFVEFAAAWTGWELEHVAHGD